ncbi:hypothetical protein [Gemmatimonas sp.]|uniref:hypothetical protein n=1 Tax=Gemmatimonas sp. TaxID=1962908 RepID=UPI0031BF8AA7|nr:hypothetical protein [Gemmatimonas sp.]
MIVLYGSDRAWRLALDAALRDLGVAVRTASRQAELAKCLAGAGSAVELVIVGPTRDDETVVRATVSSLAAHLLSGHRVDTTTPGETIAEIVRRAQSLLNR